MSESSQFSWPRRALAENPALLVSGIYFLASLIGLVYSWFFLRAFGINVFQFAEISDFLLASLKEPFTWALAILAVLLVVSDNANSLRVQRRGPSRLFGWYGSEGYRRSNYLVLLFLVVASLYLLASSKERAIRDGAGDSFIVHLSDSSAEKHRVLLGTTARFVFLYDRVSENVDVHPNESILMMTKHSPGSREE